MHSLLITVPLWPLPVTESVALPPYPRHCIMTSVPRPTCPKCHSDLVLKRLTPSGVNLRLLYFFECSVCERVQRKFGMLRDPMQSEQTAGWLRGELRAPS
jgi:hypothetical protein